MAFRMQKKNIALIGYMGTGKTTIGKKLAQKLGLKLVDTDALIEKRQKKSIAKIFETEGEAGFRKLEGDLLKELVVKENLLISTGGGIVLNENNRKILKDNTFLVTLSAKPESIYVRVKNDTTRPLLQDQNPYQKIVAMMKERQPFYEIGEIVIQTDELSLKSCVDQIIKAYQKNEILFEI